MKKIIAIAIALTCVSAGSAQKFNYNDAQRWLEKPVSNTVNPRYDTASAVCLIEDRKIEYKAVGKDIFIFSTNYKLLKLNNDRGIEMYNKIYVPVYAHNEITDIKARTILKSGKVIDVPAGKIKDVQEEGAKYKIFAMEGVEKGAQIEYTYTVKKPVSISGVEMFQNGTVPTQQAFFTLIVPENLRFSAKGHNGFAVSTDSLINDRRVIAGYSENIDAIDEEKYSFRTPMLQRVEYKLSYNLSTNPNLRLYTWKEFAKRAYEVYTTRTSREEKAVDNYLKQLKLDKNADEAKQILQIEDYVKSTVNSDEDIVGEDVENLEKAIKTKNTNRSGIVRLLATIFDKTGINYQLVFPSNRNKIPVDEEVEIWNSVEEVIFYFPNTKKFIAPYAGDFRYPFIPPVLAGTRGLFLKTTTIGTLKAAVGVFGDIEMEPFEKHAHNMQVNIKFNSSLDSLFIDSKQILTGYGATNYRPIYTYLPKEQQETTTKEIIQSIAKSDNITNIKVENKELNDAFDNKPLVISGNIHTAEMIERAGNKILLKIGDAIGRQEEMYQEKPRQLPIELSYPHVLDRELILEIPDGYIVKNPNDANINIVFKDAGKTTMSFISTHKLEGNKLTINISETYDQLKYPLAQFNDFKKIINAAADFNKVVLVLEKK
ncbi:DUF3857 domain-containing protein [Polluticaenibacter yanchengensis]|uniref:DUF3857 domain-containing protein n=1 Tax=Polluticaenibacter yanchengensis TaxID=3014562 RepID=A0ABT4UNZ5_9BACT|nr:DUF3857 domain-containing protein [Chitinophagaceae bacterium LY-5]